MPAAKQKIVVLESDAAARQALLDLIARAGYEGFLAESGDQTLALAREHDVDLALLDYGFPGLPYDEVIASLKGSAVPEGIRIILLTAGGAQQRALCLDLGADDVISRPWEPVELVARIRLQLRAKHTWEDLREKMRIAEEGQQFAHTAFEALAVTEKMTKDAFSLERGLKIGVAATFVIAVLMAGIFFLYSHRATQVTQRAYSVIARLEGGLARQQNLIAEARKLREQIQPQQGGSASVAGVEKELASTNARLGRVEHEAQAAERIIRSDSRSVCLLHVAVAFRHRDSGKRLRYGGINQQGEPLQDSEGNPIMTIEGRGPEVRVHVFGTGFLAQAGLIVTNRHVAEPWWKNEDLSSLSEQSVDPEISAIEAYFPDWPRGFPVEIGKISQESDLAVMRVDATGLKRPPLAIDAGKTAAISGEPIVSMGYATGLAAILARAEEGTVQRIVSQSNGDAKKILDGLAQQNLIRPLTTQGHLGDVLSDKIVFDAQTAQGGSGGPLFNSEGKVIGVTYAVIRGFGGSNFGIPIRYAEPLLRK